MKNRTELVVDTIFLIVLSLAVIVLLFDIHFSGTVCEPAETTVASETCKAVSEYTEPVSQATEPSSGLYDVPLDAELQLHIISEAIKAGIDPEIIFAMAYRESSYNPKSVGDGGDSYGLLQIQPKWHKDRMNKLGCTDLLDPYQNVIVGIDYLSEQMARYNGNMGKALTAYNAGHYSGTVTNYAKTIMAMAKELGGECK
jgi:soluble lytic murein transglycosylase-like protein